MVILKINGYTIPGTLKKTRKGDKKMLISGWDHPLANLRSELVQLEEEGYVVPESVKLRVAMLHPEADKWSERITDIYKRLEDLPVRDGWPYEEPDELDEIRRLRPDGPRRLEIRLSDSELLERYHGAWRGRSVGCALGKPVEAKPRAWIKELLTAQGEWELNDYFRCTGKDDWCPKSRREHIQYMEPDDDIHYTLIGLRVMEEKGADFQWNDVADCWNARLPYSAICTAETQAILNYNMRCPRFFRELHIAATPEFTRRYNNPYREWIGAAIRADFWGYAVPGDPELAAEFAYRDACWTHTKNGIYAEMFTAAVISAAFAESDPVRLIEIGLSEIPVNCRFSEAVRLSLAWRKECPTWEAFMDRLDARYAGMSSVHAINNLQIVVMALLYGNMTIDRNTALAVMGGMDTDCTGATVGSITGIINPESRLAERLNDTIVPQFIGENTCRMKTLAERTLAVRNAIRRQE